MCARGGAARGRGGAAGPAPAEKMGRGLGDLGLGLAGVDVKVLLDHVDRVEADVGGNEVGPRRAERVELVEAQERHNLLFVFWVGEFFFGGEGRFPGECQFYFLDAGAWADAAVDVFAFVDSSWYGVLLSRRGDRVGTMVITNVFHTALP